jgi:hypothetical protein
MRIVPFPGRSDVSPHEAWHAEVEAALNGDAPGSVAESWRELREDVRALAPPIAPDFERELRERIAERGAPPRSRRPSPSQRTGASTAPTPARAATPTDSTRSGPTSGRPHRSVGWPRITTGRLGAAGIVATAGAVVAAVVIAGPWRGITPPQSGPAQRVPAQSGSAKNTAERVVPLRAGTAGESHRAQTAVAGPVAPTTAGAASAPGRVQQLSASISLAPTPSDLQETADRVARLAVSAGGFVQSSHVQVQTAGTSEANLMLRLPSAKLSATLASLGQLAPVRAESQSLQDITDAFDAARQRLADATAERQALLRALSAATTQGQIDSLRERLSQSRSAIAEARSALQAVSRRGSTAEVEVTVLGEAHAGSEGLTLHRGLHDAGRVLLVVVTVLLIAAAILLPLALLLTALLTGRRAWLRHRRERALDAR